MTYIIRSPIGTTLKCTACAIQSVILALSHLHLPFPDPFHPGPRILFTCLLYTLTFCFTQSMTVTILLSVSECGNPACLIHMLRISGIASLSFHS